MGGTLDANCEDKEGAWAGFQAFLALYEMRKERRCLDWASHALDVTLSATHPTAQVRTDVFDAAPW